MEAKFKIGDVVARTGADKTTLIVEKIIAVTQDGKYITTGTGWTVLIGEGELHLATATEIAEHSAAVERETAFLAASLERGNKMGCILERGRIAADVD